MYQDHLKTLRVMNREHHNAMANKLAELGGMIRRAW
jgi:hypothetical protein